MIKFWWNPGSQSIWSWLAIGNWNISHMTQSVPFVNREVLLVKTKL